MWHILTSLKTFKKIEPTVSTDTIFKMFFFYFPLYFTLVSLQIAIRRCLLLFYFICKCTLVSNLNVNQTIRPFFGKKTTNNPIWITHWKCHIHMKRRNKIKQINGSVIDSSLTNYSKIEKKKIQIFSIVCMLLMICSVVFTSMVFSQWFIDGKINSLNNLVNENSLCRG